MRRSTKILIAVATWTLSFTGPATAAPARLVPESSTQMQLSFAPVVRKTAPAVVNIYSKRKVKNPYANDPLFSRFFRGREQTQGTLGSGVIVRSDGVIVTNNHVIAGADEIVVVMADRREFEAKVLLADERTDVAVLRVNTAGKALPTLAFHNSDDAEVGDIVLAIGNPFGVGQSVTQGIISALARTRAGVSDYQFFIQTDASINRGNSGGALVTVSGELIGINTAIYSQSGGSVGIGFAIPANMVKTIVNTAMSGSKTIARPWLGLSTQTVTAALADSLDLERPMGVLVNEVSPASPAAQAGIVSGDVITKVDDFAVDDQQSLNFRTTTKGVGSTVALTYLRNGQFGTAVVRLVRAPETIARDITVIDGRNPLHGTRVANMSPAFADEIGSDITSGVMIIELSRVSVAARLGFLPGDIILTINERKIASVDALQSVLSSRPAVWNVSLKRNGQILKLSIEG